MKPTGDLVLNEDFAGRWASIDNNPEMWTSLDNDPDRLACIARVRRIPESVRDSLHALWSTEYAPRDDGGRGLYVLDHLGFVWDQRRRSSIDIAEALSMSVDYVEALKSALFEAQPA